MLKRKGRKERKERKEEEEEEEEDEEGEEEDEDEDEEDCAKGEGCVSKDLCGGFLTHPLKWGHREGEPWTGKLLRSRFTRRLLSRAGFFPASFPPPTYLLSLAVRTPARSSASPQQQRARGCACAV